MTRHEVAPANADQEASWDGREGARWAARADYLDGMVRAHHERLMAAAGITPAERVLDIGCGNGEVTLAAAEVAPLGAATGIDLSSAMVAIARSRAAGRNLMNAHFIHGDAQLYQFADEAYDVVVSRFGSMFFGDQVAAFRNIRRSLLAGGRLVLMSWRSAPENEWFREIVSALTVGRDLPVPPAGAPSPFRHAVASDVEHILRASGFTGVSLTAVDLPQIVGPTAAEAFDRLFEVVGWLTEGLEPDELAHARQRLRDVLAAHAGPGGVVLGSAAWLITARAG